MNIVLTMKAVKSTAIQVLGICIIAVVLPKSAETAEDQLLSHTDVFDITTIYNPRPEENISIANSVGHKPDRNVEIHLFTNAIGMPIEFDGRIISSEKKSLEFISDKSYDSSIFTHNTITYNAKNWEISKFSMPNTVSIPSNYNLLLWKANNNTESFQIRWRQKNTVPTTCISVSYILQDSSKCTLSMKGLQNENNKNSTDYSYNFQQAESLTTVVIKRDNRLIENEFYVLSFDLEKNSEKECISRHRNRCFDYRTIYASDCKIGIKRIASCQDDYAIEEIYTVPEVDIIQKMSQTEFSFNVYPFGNTPNLINTYTRPSTSSLTCLNGGFVHKDKCLCPPGFKGNNCDFACGPNTFGADCSGMCSVHLTQCQQKKLCTNSFGCTCPVGYTGQYCAIECSRGKYGVNCNQTCSNKCNAGTCDIYSGACDEGCKPSYISPSCEEKYQWLVNAPQLLSNSTLFKSLQLLLNLNPENINGSKTMPSVFYQIIYKAAVNESEFHYMDPVEIGEQTSAEITIDGLKPGFTYTVGAILISEDGNYNSEDIRTANYSTLCQLSKSTYYDVNLTSGIHYINVTWNELNRQNENNCTIIEYTLKLTYNDTKKKQYSYSEEVKTKNNNGYTFENLLSGRKYTIEATAVSVAGQTIMLKTSNISTQPNGFVEIKYVKAQLENNQSSVVITWNKDDNMEYEVPITYIVNFKVNKYFSCSHKIVESNWTSHVVHNDTKFNISDLTPNTQYIVKVESSERGYTYGKNFKGNYIFFKTPKSIPKLTPIYYNNSYITNDSASFNWTINRDECIQLNGQLLGYYVILKNIVDGTEVANFSKQGTMGYDALKSDTKYELKVYVKTNFGINFERALVIPFKTKSTYLVAVNDLTVYKKNLKEKSLGIRWDFPNEHSNTLDGFIITVIANNEKKNIIQEMTVKPEKCTAWPSFYCTTIQNLTTKIQYKINIKVKTLDYPEGGLSASTVGDFNHGMPDQPRNLNATDIGPNNITLEWDIPWIFNGVLKSFIINIEEIASENNTECCGSQPDIDIPITDEIPHYKYPITKLNPGSTYSIGVLTKTSSYGPSSRIQVTTTKNENQIDDITNNKT